MANKQEKGGGTIVPHYALGPVKDHVRAAAESIGPKFGITTVLGVGLRAGESDHPKGLALDFMTRNGGPLAEYVKANASAYGVTYIIWNQHIWSVARSAEGWRAMANRGSDTANHKDHVHVSFSPSPGTGIPSASASGGTATSPSTNTGIGCGVLLIGAATATEFVHLIAKLIGA